MRSYDGRFPALTRARADRAYSLGASLSPRRFTQFGASPELSCVAQRTLSNVAL
ncbi:hypothetical protein KM176_03940 [Pseudooceanicola sp. CBS1P-1]|uniref:Uncharacterized protein n=1 Tax=Pseudooceanicola albus TaxID=2692189 RepID=A0A6L7G688_9RHOB|nr:MULTISPECIES: hypothetical protein [Pseudooceanicola]MBT9383004.1 hypothetical protein [Pseudooceanicola endophyticus]MXN19192.1 hypothetical protein [Pseudooceanicola albus]